MNLQLSGRVPHYQYRMRFGPETYTVYGGLDPAGMQSGNEEYSMLGEYEARPAKAGVARSSPSIVRLTERISGRVARVEVMKLPAVEREDPYTESYNFTVSLIEYDPSCGLPDIRSL